MFKIVDRKNEVYCNRKKKTNLKKKRKKHKNLRYKLCASDLRVYSERMVLQRRRPPRCCNKSQTLMPEHVVRFSFSTPVSPPQTLAF